jgi:outer membrane protein OmpA-like peptidoglycan-associated protein
MLIDLRDATSAGHFPARHIPDEQRAGIRMKYSRALISPFTAVILATIGISTGAQAACEDLARDFDRAVAARSLDSASRALAAIADDMVCGARVDEFRARLVDFLVTYAGSPGIAEADRARVLKMAEGTIAISRNWRGAEKFADYFMGRGDKVSAFEWYQQSVSFLSSNPGERAPSEERRILMTKLAAAQSLANDDHEGRTQIEYVPVTRGIDGSLEGIYSRALLRGAEAVPIPIPINFYTNETRFTSTGEKAMQELATAVLEQRVRTMKLIGHADPRGTAQHNMDLSRRRVEAVRDELLRRGVRAEIRIEWKGKEQPFDISVLPYRPAQEEEWQLDRRVEWEREAQPE